jgi:hypothetical protein
MWTDWLHCRASNQPVKKSLDGKLSVGSLVKCISGLITSFTTLIDRQLSSTRPSLRCGKVLVGYPYKLRQLDSVATEMLKEAVLVSRFNAFLSG